VPCCCRTNALRFSEPADMGSRNARTAVIQASKAFHERVASQDARTSRASIVLLQVSMLGFARI